MRPASWTGGWAVLAMAVVTAASCSGETKPPREEAMKKKRLEMVERQIVSRGVRSDAVLAAMRSVPRHEFVPKEMKSRAYHDNPLPIGSAQTISQPYIVALMTELLDLSPDDRVLEIGTGSGYQAAVLAEIVDTVFSIEIIPELAERAEATLRALHYDRVMVRAGDGYRGWPDEAPFDGIIVTAAPDHVPAPLVEQLAEGGTLVIPVGDASQTLMVFTRKEGVVSTRDVIPVRFVPMTGEAEAR